MSFVTKRLTDAAIGVAVADDPASLSVLAKPGCAAAIWRRRIPSGIRTWLDDLGPDTLPTGRIVLRPDAVHQAVGHLCEMAGTPPGIERDWLQDDIADLAAKFADVMSAPFIRLRLDAVTNNACSKFHIDAVRARLVCTYRGPGTQYGISTNGDEPHRVFQVATGAPILLRGTLWPEDPPSGLLHRSPPIEGTGEVRLVMVLDPIFDSEDAACGAISDKPPCADGGDPLIQWRRSIACRRRSGIGSMTRPCRGPRGLFNASGPSPWPGGYPKMKPSPCSPNPRHGQSPGTGIQHS